MIHDMQFSRTGNQWQRRKNDKMIIVKSQMTNEPIRLSRIPKTSPRIPHHSVFILSLQRNHLHSRVPHFMEKTIDD